MRALITGGAGFIGAHLAVHLKEKGNEVVAVDSLVGGRTILKGLLKPNEINFVKGDVRDEKLMNELMRETDVVYHLAAHAAEGQSVFIPKYNAETNIIGSINVLTSAINHGVRKFVYTSSIAAYGGQQELPIKEDCCPDPEDPYGISKMAFENYLRVYHRLGQIDPYIVRFFNVYGPWQRMEDPYRGVIPIFINRILKGKPPIIFGDGNQTRAFTYISDIVEPLASIVEYYSLINNPINIGSRIPYSVKFVAKSLLSKMGASELGIRFAERRESDIVDTYCDVSKAKRLMNYKAKVGLSKGLNLTIEWAKKFGKQEFKYNGLCEIEKLKHRVYREEMI